jgi:hypothetical protein
LRLLGDEGLLLLRSQLDYAATFFLGGERGEDVTVETEGGVAHV